MNYQTFIESKILRTESNGFSIDEKDLHPSNLPHQRDIIRWAGLGGRRAIFASFGLGKTQIQLELAKLCILKNGGYALIICPLGVKGEFKNDAERLGLSVEYVRNNAEIEKSSCKILLTNYERVRDGGIDVNKFIFVSLDEASVLRSYGSKTYQEFLPMFANIPYRYVATATPSPNKYKELIHYAGFLGIMDTGQALTRFFKRDSTKANNLTLYPHKEKEFWLWMSTWAIFITKPSDLGYSDEGYDLPPLNVSYHMIQLSQEENKADRDGQTKLYRDIAFDLKTAAKEKRDSITERNKRFLNILNDILYICRQTFSNANTQGNKSGLLQKESGTGEKTLSGLLSSEQRKDQQGTEKSLHERVLEDLQKKEKNTGTVRGKESKETGEVRNGFGISEQGKEASNTEHQKESVNEDKRETEGGIRDNLGGIQQNIIEPGREMCYLRNGEIIELPEEILCGSLSQDWKGEGSVMSSLQFWIGSIQRQYREFTESGGILEQIIIFCELNEEQRQVEKALKEIGIPTASIYGNLQDHEKEERLQDWKDKKYVVLLSKPIMYGSGVNLQQASKMVFLGIDYKFNDFIQSIHRVHRFQQKFPCGIHIIYTDSEENILKELLAKWQRHNELVDEMTGIIKEYGLNNAEAINQLKRSIGIERKEVRGKSFISVNNDNVLEYQSLPDDHFGLILTSIPFSNHYEYTPSYNDFGHTNNDDHFFAQMDYLTPNLYRTLQPGRLAVVHVKDRIMFANVTGYGMPTVNPFHMKTTFHFMKHGFVFMGMITVETDVVRENNQTYRLGWTEQCKDGSKMGVGCPEYILLFRKLPTDTSKAYADIPVFKTKKEYRRGKWQIDARGKWNSSGDSLFTPDEIKAFGVSRLSNMFSNHFAEHVYDYETHVALANMLDDEGKLPATFEMLKVPARTGNVWDDIVRMRTLNSQQTQSKEQNHVCPFQLDIVKRAITRYSNPGDLIADPFGGIGSVMYEGITLGRKVHSTELNTEYWQYANGYAKEAEHKKNIPTLFDTLTEAI